MRVDEVLALLLVVLGDASVASVLGDRASAASRRVLRRGAIKRLLCDTPLCRHLLMTRARCRRNRKRRRGKKKKKKRQPLVEKRRAGLGEGRRGWVSGRERRWRSHGAAAMAWVSRWVSSRHRIYSPDLLWLGLRHLGRGRSHFDLYFLFGTCSLWYPLTRRRR